MISIEEDILDNYEKTPIIVLYEEALKEDLLVMCQRNKLERSLMGSSNHNLKKISTWDYGILFLEEKDAIGLNTMFKKDSIVMIA